MDDPNAYPDWVLWVIVAACGGVGSLLVFALGQGASSDFKQWVREKTGIPWY